VDYWKRRGATDEMFAEAYAKIARRTMNAPEGTEDSFKCHRALCDGLRVHANERQLTNLTYVAEHSTNDVVRDAAIWSFHERKACTMDYLDFAQKLLASTNMSQRVGSSIFSCMGLDMRKGNDCPAKYRTVVVNVARGHIARGGVAVLSADALLLRNDPDYGSSVLHSKAIRDILVELKSDKCKLPGNNKREIIKRYEQMLKETKRK